MNDEKDYGAARARAQQVANATGMDVGLERNPLFGTWSHRLLPRRRASVRLRAPDRGRLARGLREHAAGARAKMSLHQRIAVYLGWTEAMVRSFSLRALRDIVATGPPGKARDELVAEISRLEKTGEVIRPRT